MTRLTKWVRAVRGGGLDGKPITYKPDWVGRALPRAGLLPPTEAEQAISAGRVVVNGRVVTDPLTLISPDDAVHLDGERVGLAWPTLVLAFHKPAGCIVGGSDDRGRPTVFEVFREVLSPDLARYGWHAVGRLDMDTTGLLLFTNDERVVRHVTLPATHLPKRYLAQVHGTPDEARLEPLRQGIVIDGFAARPAKARVRGPDTVELTITEGQKHQVKRMLRAVKLPVRRLHREAIGDLELDLPERGWRQLTPSEIESKLAFPIGHSAPSLLPDPSTGSGRTVSGSAGPLDKLGANGRG